MIPVKLSISGFLSYRDSVEIDFTRINLACIAGPNGAGKSSLLDAITWVLFGQARKKDDSLVNTQSSTAKVRLDFLYENNLYSVRRSKKRETTASLEFLIFQPNVPNQQGLTYDVSPADGTWKSLSEATLGKTEDAIQKTLHLGYDTFTNASFFLQGKADQFTQQTPNKRKEILKNILNLEIWEEYREKTAELRRSIEYEINVISGQIEEINNELAEEPTRRQRLEELEANLLQADRMQKEQEQIVNAALLVAVSLAENERVVGTLLHQVQAESQRLQANETNLKQLVEQIASYSSLLNQGDEIETSYRAWQTARKQLDEWEIIASQVRQMEALRQDPRAELLAARTRLEGERDSLLLKQKESMNYQVEIARIKTKILADENELTVLEERLEQRKTQESVLQDLHQRQAVISGECPRLKKEMDELKARIDQLSAAHGADCPLCGQPLEQEPRRDLIGRLTSQGRDLGDQYRLNQAILQTLNNEIKDLESQVRQHSQLEDQIRTYEKSITGLQSSLLVFQNSLAEWEKTYAPRLTEVQHALEQETFLPEARNRLSEIDAKLERLGYDPAAHQAVRLAEETGRPSEARLRDLENARAAIDPIQGQITRLETEITAQKPEVNRLQQEYKQATDRLDAARAQAPDLEAAETLLQQIQEDVNRMRFEVGAAAQNVAVLGILMQRKLGLQTEQDKLARQVSQYRQLERAFSNNGIPALLIEQAIPEIENKANFILDRLSGGSMYVQLVTQRPFHDPGREDLRETLDIQINDGVGQRDYELYSGGEAFRVNFAIRLALSEILAQRAGARLQTLVIDEGFGSQDTQGRQRLIEAINQVSSDFAMILVITHIEELKDAFPTRIEVEKTEKGSSVRVM